MSSKWKIRASRLLAERRTYNGWDYAIAYDEFWDITILHDDRPSEIREPQWVGLRNYLYGYDCRILAESECPTHGVMLIDAARHLARRMAREFVILTRPEHTQEYRDQLNLPISLPPHTIWGRVVVENGKPIGLYVDGRIVRQPIDKRWTEYS